jgi:N-formylglutamate amidohydrolase
MMLNAPEPAAFARLGQSGADSPLVIAVPHAGRIYPEEMLAAARLPRESLETIEDRYADLLVSDAVRDGAIAIVARTARAYVDLNRDEREIDPAILAAPPEPGTLVQSARVAGGLGVIPSRIAAGAIWLHPLETEEVARRIARIHRPYHAAIDEALAAAEARHGVGLLIDCHSMPALGRGHGAARIVIGDLQGRSAGSRFIAAALQSARTSGLVVARNQPYAGGHTLDRHGAPPLGRHAIQIEIDRSLYLDSAGKIRGAGLAVARRAVATIARALMNEARDLAVAAE